MNKDEQEATEQAKLHERYVLEGWCLERLMAHLPKDVNVRVWEVYLDYDFLTAIVFLRDVFLCDEVGSANGGD